MCGEKMDDKYVNITLLYEAGKFVATRTNNGGIRVMQIDELPVEDVRPVTFCKDCFMYRRDREIAEASYLDPDYYCALLRCEMPEDGFCSYGNMQGGDTDR